MGSLQEENIDLEFQGLSSIYKEAFNIISSWKLIFTQITLTLIVPLSLLSLTYIKVFLLLVPKMYKNFYHLISCQKLTFWFLTFLYFIFLTIFSLLSISLVAYTTSCIYTHGQVTFKKIILVAPKLWSRLLITIFCPFLAMYVLISCYTLLALTLLSSTLDCIQNINNIFAIPLFFIISVILLFPLAGFGYLTIAWELVGIVIALEEMKAIKALVQSKELLQGKMGVAMVIHFELVFSIALVQFLFEMTIEDHEMEVLSKFGLGILYLILLVILIIFGLVVQIVMYFACKAYHNEHIKLSSSLDYFDVNYGDYVPLKVLEQC